MTHRGMRAWSAPAVRVQGPPVGPRDGTDLDVSDEVAAALVVMSPATMDRRLAADRAAMTLPGRGDTEPGCHRPGCFVE